MPRFNHPLPENIRKCLPVALRPLPTPATRPVEDGACDRKAEKLIHHLFEAWLRLNGLAYVHSRMDKKSTIREGWPDFSVFGPGGKVAFVEIKLKGKELSVSQMEVMLELLRLGQPYQVCYTDAEAIVWTSERMGAALWG